MLSACQVVPEIPSFAVDDGFTYIIPDGLDVSVGSKVRIRVSGRRLNGYVTAVIQAPSDRKLLPIDSVSGDVPLFDEATLDVCRWAATHYVAPLSVLLKRTGPPNVARRGNQTVPKDPPIRQAGQPRLSFTISRSPHREAIARAVAEAPVDRALGILVPTSSEAASITKDLRGTYGDRVVTATSSMPGKEITQAWVAAATRHDAILVGTREIGLWPLRNGGSWILVEDGRRVMKSPSTPTVHAREILVARARRMDGTLSVIGPVPTLEILAMEPDLVKPDGRWWPNVEVVDRSLEPPTGSLLSDQTKRAISAVAERGRVFLLVSARGYAPAFRCIDCSTLRTCVVCDTTAATDDRCRRCSARLQPCVNCKGERFEPLGAGIGRVIDDVARFVDSADVGEAGSGATVTVGSERDLVDLEPIDLGVLVDIDGMSGAPHYRAREDTLRLAARLANRTGRGGGRRLLVQTSDVSQAIVEALEAGHADGFLAAEAVDRERAGFPPFGQLLAIETSGAIDADALIRTAVGDMATVRGPAAMKDRSRWLVSGTDLDDVRIGLRSVAETLRNSGARVRIDADPIDL